MPIPELIENQPSIDPKFEVVIGSNLTANQISEFNRIWRVAFRKDKDVLDRDKISTNDFHFFMYDLNYNPNIAIAIGRLRKIEQIKIGDRVYEHDVWGRADIGVSGQQGRGYGKSLILNMIEFAKEQDMESCIGFHGKTTTLSEFYRKCGLEIDYDLGARIYRPRDNALASLDNVNVSHFPNDPFIAQIKANSDKVTLPFSW